MKSSNQVGIMVISCILLVILFACWLVSCLVSKGVDKRNYRDTSKGIYALVMGLDYLANTGAEVPEKEDEFLNLLRNTIFDSYKQYLEFNRQPICDKWNEPLYYIRYRKDIIAIGSSGADRQWRNGNGDDIIVFVKNVQMQQSMLNGDRGSGQKTGQVQLNGGGRVAGAKERAGGLGNGGGTFKRSAAEFVGAGSMNLVHD